MNKKNLLLFLSVLIIAFSLRFYKLAEIPPSLNWDEVSIGYNAYSILKTGKDEWGKFLPLSFQAFGDYKLPLYVYLDVPFIALIGLNEIAVRLPSALFGIGIVLLSFLVIKELTNNIRLALWGMFIGAILPWLVTLSRIALEANLALFLTLGAFYLLLVSQRKKGILPYSAVFLGLSAFSYNSSRVMILPLLLLAAFLFKSWRKKEVVISLIILIVFISLAFFQTFMVDSKMRYRWTTILDEGAIGKINQARGSSQLNPILNRLINNKATYFIVEASKNYTSHFNPNFLFLKGGSNFQFSVPKTGQIYLVLLIPILLGILYMIQERKNWQLFILGWMLIAPVPAAITRDAPHALRAIFLTIPFLLCAVIGIQWIKDRLSLKIFFPLAVLTILVLLVDTYMFWQNYAGDYRDTYSQSWQYGYQQAVDFVNKQKDKYDLVVFTKAYGEPHIFTLFYSKYDPLKYQTSGNLIRYQKSDWFWVDRFDKFEFINDWEIKSKVSDMKNTLLVTSPGNYPPNSQILDTIKFLDGKTAFEIVAVK